MKQPTPTVTAEDVERLIGREFPLRKVSEIKDLLEGYGREDYEREPHRVQAAILKLSHGSLEELLNQVGQAKIDYRDVLSQAEYPQYSKKGYNEMAELLEEERSQIMEADWEQYRKWFEE